MIDVVFLLLVYFMAATEFKLGEEIYRLDLPQRGQADPFDLPRDPLRIIVTSSGPDGYTLRLSGPAQLGPDADFGQLYELLRESRRSEAAAGGLLDADHPLIVEPGAGARWEHAMEAFNAAVRARYTNVTFAPPG